MIGPLFACAVDPADPDPWASMVGSFSQKAFARVPGFNTPTVSEKSSCFVMQASIGARPDLTSRMGFSSLQQQTLLPQDTHTQTHLTHQLAKYQLSVTSE